MFASLKKLFGIPKRSESSKSPASRQKARLSVEGLEERALMTGINFPGNGWVVIAGNENFDDLVVVESVRDNAGNVSYNLLLNPQLNPSDPRRDDEFGVPHNRMPEGISIYTLSGHDTINVVVPGHHTRPNGTVIPVVATGGPGNDKLVGGFGNDYLDGSEGNDIVIGRGGNDQLFGREGRDLLIGSWGRDILKGGVEDDIVIGGVTVYEPFQANERSALDTIMAIWGQTDRTTPQRKATLSNSGLLNSRTVFNDNERDEIDFTVTLNPRETPAPDMVFSDAADALFIDGYVGRFPRPVLPPLPGGLVGRLDVRQTYQVSEKKLKQIENAALKEAKRLKGSAKHKAPTVAQQMCLTVQL